MCDPERVFGAKSLIRSFPSQHLLSLLTEYKSNICILYYSTRVGKNFLTQQSLGQGVAQMVRSSKCDLGVMGSKSDIQAGLGKQSFQKNATFLRSFVFFPKERNVLSFFSVLY